MSYRTLIFRIFFENVLYLIKWIFRNCIQLLVLGLLVFHIQTSTHEHANIKVRSDAQHQYLDNRTVEHHNFLHDLIEKMRRLI